MFTGLCAFPLTPMRNNEVDSRANKNHRTSGLGAS